MVKLTRESDRDLQVQNVDSTKPLTGNNDVLTIFIHFQFKEISENFFFFFNLIFLFPFSPRLKIIVCLESTFDFIPDKKHIFKFDRRFFHFLSFFLLLQWNEDYVENSAPASIKWLCMSSYVAKWFQHTNVIRTIIWNIHSFEAKQFTIKKIVIIITNTMLVK
jgi:hypothetical protein